MPYTMSIYSDENLPTPKAGDVFVVVRVEEDVVDFHWGKTTHVDLEVASQPHNEPSQGSGIK